MEMANFENLVIFHQNGANYPSLVLLRPAGRRWGWDIEIFQIFEKIEPKIFKILILFISKYDVRTLSLDTLGTRKRP